MLFLGNLNPFVRQFAANELDSTNWTSDRIPDGICKGIHISFAAGTIGNIRIRMPGTSFERILLGYKVINADPDGPDKWIPMNERFSSVNLEMQRAGAAHPGLTIGIYYEPKE